MVDYKKKLMKTKNQKKRYYYLKIYQNGGKKIISKNEYIQKSGNVPIKSFAERQRDKRAMRKILPNPSEKKGFAQRQREKRLDRRKMQPDRKSVV